MQSEEPASTPDLLSTWLGKSKTAGHRVVSAYIKTLPFGERFHDEKLSALVRHNPGRPFNADIITFALCSRPPYFTKSLFIESRSGGLMDCSWKKCVTNFFGKYSKERNVRGRALNALRNEAFKSKKMQAAREELGSRCAKCEKVCKKLVVDHAGKPFAQIVDEYVAERGTTVSGLGISYAKGAYHLRSGGRAWRDFHDANAELVGLCAACNLSLGSRGYRSVVVANE